MPQTILNCLNLVIIQGKVTHLIHNNGTKFYLKNKDISISVFHTKDAIKITEGDYVSVFGVLRYSHTTAKYKIKAAKIINCGPSILNEPINHILVEGYVKNIATLGNTLSADFGSINLSHPDETGASEGYELPIGIRFKGPMVEIVKDILNENTPFLLEGSLIGNPITFIQGTHCIPSVKITR